MAGILKEAERAMTNDTGISPSLFSPDVPEPAGRVGALRVAADGHAAHVRCVETGLLRDGGAELPVSQAANKRRDAWKLNRGSGIR